MASHVAAVDDDLGAVGLAGVDVGRHLVAVGLGDQRAHVGILGAVTDLQRGGALGDLGDQIVGDRADGDRRADGHAALTGGAEAGVDHRVGGQVEVGVGQDHRVVLGAAEGLDALACAVPVAYTYCAIGVEPTKDTDLMPWGWSAVRRRRSCRPAAR